MEVRVREIKRATLTQFEYAQLVLEIGQMNTDNIVRRFQTTSTLETIEVRTNDLNNETTLTNK